MVKNSKFEIRNSKLRQGLIFSLIVVMTPAIITADDLDNSVLMRAMTDELNRSMTSLCIVNQAKPYYLNYRVVDAEIVSIEAQFGGLIYSDTERDRDVYVDLRVGGYDFDNSNFMCLVGGSGLIESDRTSLPLDDDYDALRHALWMVTDGTYKKALERLSRKLAYIQNKQVKDEIADFARVPVCRDAEPPVRLELRRGEWESYIVELSGLFRRYPRLRESKVTFRAKARRRYFIDSEGNRSRVADQCASVDVTAKARSADGDPLEDYLSFCAPTPGELPEPAVIAKAIQAMAETLSLLVDLKKEESYSGPVLFTGQAAAELFFQVLGRGISDPRTPLFENEMIGENMSSGLGSLCGRINRKVLPDFISVYDDPTLQSWEGVPLFGRFAIDDQGVRAKRVEIVNRGRLINFFMSRSPTKKIPEPNGHGRFRSESYGFRYTGLPGVMVVNADGSPEPADPVQTLIDLCKSCGNSYGIIISRLETRPPGDPMERYLRYYAGSSKGEPLVSAPVVAYKVDTATGTVSLVRGLEFSGATARIMRDICAAGSMPYVHNFYYRDKNGNEYPISVIAPAVVIEEVDLTAKETKASKPPVLKHPCFTGG